MKYKVGDMVRVVKKIKTWKFSNGGGNTWTKYMDKTIGNVYTIIKIDKYIGYLLETQAYIGNLDGRYNFWYPIESLGMSIGEQLMFDFKEVK